MKRIPFRCAPSLLHLHYSDTLFAIVAWAGLVLSLIAISGVSSMGPAWISILTWLLIWGLYLSIVNVGQLFYGFGWESLLLEAGFYTIFLDPSSSHINDFCFTPACFQC
ncbi:MAG: hypothetical protein PVI44_13545 [Balneolaceae bacterium]